MWGEQFLGIVRWGCGENSSWVGVRWGLWGDHGHCSTVLCSASKDLAVVAVGGPWLLGELWKRRAYLLFMIPRGERSQERVWPYVGSPLDQHLTVRCSNGEAHDTHTQMGERVRN